MENNNNSIPQSMNLIIFPEDYHSNAARKIVAEMYDDLTPLYGGTPSGTVPPLDFDQPGSLFILGYIAAHPVACGAFIPLDAGCGEIKRMFVEPGWRGRGYSRKILAYLEDHARNHGFKTLRLETGVKQPAAIKLYETSGFHRIENFGKYAGDPTSICFEKIL